MLENELNTKRENEEDQNLFTLNRNEIFKNRKRIPSSSMLLASVAVDEPFSV